MKKFITLLIGIGLFVGPMTASASMWADPYSSWNGGYGYPGTYYTNWGPQPIVDTFVPWYATPQYTFPTNLYPYISPGTSWAGGYGNYGGYGYYTYVQPQWTDWYGNCTHPLGCM